MGEIEFLNGEPELWNMVNGEGFLGVTGLALRDPKITKFKCEIWKIQALRTNIKFENIKIETFLIIFLFHRILKQSLH